MRGFLVRGVVAAVAVLIGVNVVAAWGVAEAPPAVAQQASAAAVADPSGEFHPLTPAGSGTSVRRLKDRRLSRCKCWELGVSLRRVFQLSC